MVGSPPFVWSTSAYQSPSHSSHAIASSSSPWLASCSCVVSASAAFAAASEASAGATILAKPGSPSKVSRPPRPKPSPIGSGSTSGPTIPSPGGAAIAPGFVGGVPVLSFLGVLVGH